MRDKIIIPIPYALQLINVAIKAARSTGPQEVLPNEGIPEKLAQVSIPGTQSRKEEIILTDYDREFMRQDGRFFTYENFIFCLTAYGDRLRILQECGRLDSYASQVLISDDAGVGIATFTVTKERSVQIM
ncbi:uncharacterized protein KY384_001274 [Bacidia gigantensis]|uniref:uncharacterized protein n=1 Tax=Bacidia gigantensis TaxID=2732470 RepID=UPI001D0381E7|nr:uncharacterized protein KY384_001274 [Bacidia gigantensis]KAG8533534.1 hypothetical protein KY384_001274 [Bacidia gigantensis]